MSIIEMMKNMSSKKSMGLILCTLMWNLVFGQINEQKQFRFLYHKNWESQLNKKPKDQKKWQDFELFAYMHARYAVPEEKTLPLVFNVLESSESRKISMEMAESQIQILNDAFAGKFEEKDHYYKDRMAGDSKIRFCFGSPQGNKAEINYKTLNLPVSVENLANLSDKKYGIEGAKKDEYINIWIVDLPDRMGGFALLPDVDESMDGIYIDPDYFGLNPDQKDYSQGRTLVHLMGQYLGLQPLWTNLDCQDDGVEDTPTHNAPNYGCYGYSHVSLCAGNEEEMIGNFMDAGLDECSSMFTKGQVARIHANLSERGYRNNLKNGKKVCEKPLNEEMVENRNQIPENLEIIPNPTSGQAEIRFTLKNPEAINLSIYNTTGALILKTSVQDLGERSGHIMLDMSQYPNGQYIVELKTYSNTITKTFLKF